MMNVWLYPAVLVLFAVLLFYIYVAIKQTYWKRRNVDYVKPSPIFGSFFPVFSLKKSVGQWLKDLYFQIGEKDFIGFYVFGEPYILLKSPRLIKSVLQKDFSHFENRTIKGPENDEFLSSFMFWVTKDYWKKIRSKVSPVFSSGKLRLMFNSTMIEANNMTDYLSKHIVHGKATDAKEVCAKYSTAVVARCAFGIDAKCFENENSEFRRISKDLFDLRLDNTVRQLMNWFASSIANYWRIALVSAETLTTLTNIFSSAVKQRSENIPAQKARDFIDLMLQLKKDNQNDVALTEPRLLAQAIQIFAAGFETVNSSLAYTIHELAINPSIQERLREEIKETIAKYNGEITYEAIQEMKYLDMCFSETLRKYPVLPFLDRRCTKDYVLPGTNVFIKEGIPVLVPMMGIHSDPKFYPDPDTYDPERFKDKSVYNTDGFNYFPFGEGPRSCIGERFGLLTIKLGFVKILSQFEVKTNQETQHPLNFEAKSFLLLTRKGVPLTFVPLKDKQL